MKNLEMFNQRSKHLLFVVLVIFCGGGFLFAGSLDINLSVSDLLATYKQTKDQNSQFKKSYNSSFNADPYSVALGRVKAKGNTLLLGGVSEVSAKLQEKNCPLSQKDISTILYYFDPDFRSAMVADLSLSTNQYLDKVPSLAAVKKSCGSFIQGCYPGHGENNLLNTCKEDIVHRYREGLISQKQLRSIKNAQMGRDKYWNVSLEDSPYDILYDVWMVSKLIFEEVQDPRSVTFFQMPASNAGGGGGGGGEQPIVHEGEIVLNDGAGNGSKTIITTNVDPVAKETLKPDNKTLKPQTDPQYDSEFYQFLEGDTPSLFSPTIFGGNVCVSSEAVIEEILPEDIGLFEDDPLFEVSDEEYREYIEKLIESLDSYFDVPLGYPKDSSSGTGVNDPDNSPGPDDIGDQDNVKKIIEKVQVCLSSCNELPFDNMIACKARCLCWEKSSPRFDPTKDLGLGPIFKIKFCTVPASPKDFSPRGKTVKSIEEIFKELLAILDTMDRGGQLGITEKKKSFLDTSAGNTKFSKVITFSIGQSIVRKTKTPVPKAMKENENKKANKELQTLLEVIKDLNNPVLVNAYVLVGSPATTRAANNVAAQNDLTQELEKQEATDKTPESSNDPEKIEKNQRYVVLGEEISNFILDHNLFRDTFIKNIDYMSDTLVDWRDKQKKP